VKLSFFDGKYFVLDRTRTQIVDSEKEAFVIAGIEEELSDKFPMIKTPPLTKMIKKNSRVVLIVVPDCLVGRGNETWLGPSICTK